MAELQILQELQEEYKSYVSEARKLIGEYEFELINKEAPTFRIKVWVDAQGNHYARASHFVQLPGAHTPYRPTHSNAINVNDAIKEVFMGLMGLTEDKENCEWEKNEYY